MTSLAIGIDDVRAAAERIAGRVHRTPVVTSRSIDERAGRTLFLKCENLQRAGAFKIRGATNRLLALSDDERGRGVVAWSSGNHAQAVALAARSLEVDAKIVMPADAPRAKRAATEGYGATVVPYDPRSQNREAMAREIAESEGRVEIPPYDDPWIMAGQGTAALELLDEVPDLDAVVAPVGGGGLLAGTATAAEAKGVRAFGAEPAGADDTARSLEAGQRVEAPDPHTIADGARTPLPGALTFPILQARAEAVVRVPDEMLPPAMALLLSRTKLLVEPTGALGLAAALEGLLPEDARRVGVILSGGNVDLDALARLLAGIG
ncbi:MAG TPA: pyridoxal-phosphate dependent enzyme [Gemmatimonadota bacterium]|nr:pyridoxal-phosphate dependent enzyme [Gemmatimonadota bacterium]